MDEENEKEFEKDSLGVTLIERVRSSLRRRGSSSKGERQDMPNGRSDTTITML